MGASIYSEEFPPRWSEPLLFVLELFEYRDSWGIRSWSDWISYEENPIATGEEQDLKGRVGRGFGGCGRLPQPFRSSLQTACKQAVAAATQKLAIARWSSQKAVEQ